VGRPALSFYPTTADHRCWPRYQHEQQRQQAAGSKAAKAAGAAATAAIFNPSH